jgi:hypothetical protein
MIYKVSYGSMTAHYGPSYIEADSEQEAKIRFGGSAFSSGERSVCMSARPISLDEMKREILKQAERENE